MQNEIFPTDFLKKKNEIIGINKTTEKAFTGMKTYKDEEIQPYMKELVGDTIQTENVAKYHFDNSNHRNQFNQSVRKYNIIFSYSRPIEIYKKKK